MNIKGKVVALLPTMAGVSSKNTNWVKSEFVIETVEQYPKKICFELFNKQDLAAKLIINSIVDVYFNLESKEFNGKWYTKASVWKINFDELQKEEQKKDEPQKEENNDNLPF